MRTEMICHSVLFLSKKQEEQKGKERKGCKENFFLLLLSLFFKHKK